MIFILHFFFFKTFCKQKPLLKNMGFFGKAFFLKERFVLKEKPCFFSQASSPANRFDPFLIATNRLTVFFR